MKEIFDYVMGGILIILVLYFVYTQVICARPGDKYYNDSWKYRNKKY